MARGTTFKTTIELDVEVVGHYRGETPARLSGPPEDCYEGEAESFELEAVLLSAVGRKVDLLPYIEDETLLEDLRGIGCEQARESMEDAYVDEMVAREEARRDDEEDR